MEPNLTEDYRIIISDPERLVGAMRGAEMRPCQLSRQSSPSELCRLVFSTSCLDLVRFGPAMLLTGTTPADCYTLIYVLDCPEAGRSFNFSLEHHDDYLALFPPGGHLDARTPKDYCNAILTVAAGPFLSLVNRLHPEIPDSFLSRSAAMRMERSDSSGLRSLLKLAWTMPGKDCHSPENQVARRLLEDQLLEAFLGALADVHTHPEPSPGTQRLRREQKFRKIRDFLADHIDQPLGLAEICAEASLSARTVEDLFHDQLGIGPHAYLRHLRLHAAKRTLDGFGAVEPGIMKRVALDHGFWHLGRFSGYYRDLFGEKPSTTLARGVRGES